MLISQPHAQAAAWCATRPGCRAIALRTPWAPSQCCSLVGRTLLAASAWLQVHCAGAWLKVLRPPTQPLLSPQTRRRQGGPGAGARPAARRRRWCRGLCARPPCTVGGGWGQRGGAERQRRAASSALGMFTVTCTKLHSHYGVSRRSPKNPKLKSSHPVVQRWSRGASATWRRCAVCGKLGALHRHAPRGGRWWEAAGALHLPQLWAAGAGGAQHGFASMSPAATL